MGTFKVGDVIICVDPSSRLTMGREYIIRYIDDGYVTIVNDIDDECQYFYWRFKLKTSKPKRNLPSWF